jgi:hypothetical protein
MVKLTCALIFLYSLYVIACSSLFLFQSFTCLIVLLYFFSFRTTYLLFRNCFHTRTNQRCHQNALDCSRYPAAIKKNKNNRSRISHFARLALVTGSWIERKCFLSFSLLFERRHSASSKMVLSATSPECLHGVNYGQLLPLSPPTVSLSTQLSLFFCSHESWSDITNSLRFRSTRLAQPAKSGSNEVIVEMRFHWHSAWCHYTIPVPLISIVLGIAPHLQLLFQLFNASSFIFFRKKKEKFKRNRFPV